MVHAMPEDGMMACAYPTVPQPADWMGVSLEALKQMHVNVMLLVLAPPQRGPGRHSTILVSCQTAF